MKLNALQKRTLRLEQLENRELLSATTWNDAAQADAALAAEMVATLNENASIDLTAAFSAAELETTATEAATIWRVVSDGDGVGEEGTLRWAVENAQPGDSIRFDASLSRDHGDGKGEYVKITLEQGEIKIDKDLTIDAYGLYRFDKLEGAYLRPRLHGRYDRRGRERSYFQYRGMDRRRIGKRAGPKDRTQNYRRPYDERLVA